MADPKKPPDFDPDKTVVEVRRSEPKKAEPPEDDESKTVVMSRDDLRKGAPAEDDDAEKTRVTAAPPRSSASPAPDDAEKTIVGKRPAPSAGAGEAEYMLVCLSGQARGKRVPLTGSEALVGSSSNCAVQVPGIESVHAKLSKEEKDWEIQNLGHAGSLIVRGASVTKSKLRSGNLLKVGEVVFRFVKVGEVFSSDYSDSELSSGIGRFLDPQFLKDNPAYPAIGVLVIALLLVAIWPAHEEGPQVTVNTQEDAQAEQSRQDKIRALLATGEVLFNAGKLVTPADQPDADSAFSVFNRILTLDPGNEEAIEWLGKIDEARKTERERRQRALEEQKRLERERAERARAELASAVQTEIDKGDQLFEEGQVAEPAGRNALVYYRKALEIDPNSDVAQERVRRAIYYYVNRGDDFRDADQPWRALESYRKASRAAGGTDEAIEARRSEMEARLKSGMAASSTKLVMYKDDKGQMFVLDSMDKVPSRFRDRAVVVEPEETAPRRR